MGLKIKEFRATSDINACKEFDTWEEKGSPKIINIQKTSIGGITVFYNERPLKTGLCLSSYPW